jgi:hypothetical protein
VNKKTCTKARKLQSKWLLVFFNPNPTTKCRRNYNTAGHQNFQPRPENFLDPHAEENKSIYPIG